MQRSLITRWGDELSATAEQAPVQRLSRIPPARRRRLAERTHAPHTDAASLVDHLSRTDVALQIARGFDRTERRLARLFVEAVEPLPLPVFEAAAAERLGAAAAPTLERLERAGLVCRSRWAGGAEVLGLVPPLSRSLRPLLWLLGDERPQGALPVGARAKRASVFLERVRDLSLTVAAVATDGPRLLRDGSPHAADLQRLLDERFGAQASLPHLERWLTRLVRLGIVAGAGGRSRVVWRRARAFFDLPPSARLPVLLSTDPQAGPGAAAPPRVPGLASPEQVRRLVAAALLELPAGHWARREALEAAVRPRILATDALTPYADLSRAIKAARRHVQAAVDAMVPTLEVYATGDGDVWLRLPVLEEGDAEAGWVVQPSHEIIVPPEVLPGQVVRLAACADLVRADVVATFALGPRSLARAAEADLDAAEVLSRLEAGAAQPLPPALDVQIAGWLRLASADVPWADAPSADEEEVTASHEVPVHRRPRTPRFPAPPPPRWPGEVGRFRRAAMEADAPSA